MKILRNTELERGAFYAVYEEIDGVLTFSVIIQTVEHCFDPETEGTAPISYTLMGWEATLSLADIYNNRFVKLDIERTL